MKIHLMSDLHLEFDYQPLSGGEVLILAGDICEYRTFKKEFHSTKLVDREPGAFKCYDFFYSECAKYNKVFMIMGNHEHYHHRFDKTYNDFKDLLPPNVTLLEDEVVEHNGVMFMGSTLWTDLNRGDPLTVYSVKQFMNDYRVIQNFYPEKNLYHKLTPEHTFNSHKKTLEYFKQTIESNPDKPFVVITHHGPSYESVHTRYRHDTHINGGYTSDLSKFILEYPQIKKWVHGHMHDPVDYKIGETHVISNPRGYIGHEDTSAFDPEFSFEL